MFIIVQASPLKTAVIEQKSNDGSNFRGIAFSPIYVKVFDYVVLEHYYNKP